MLQHAAMVRKKAPCIVFDNADHFKIELQECIFRFARAVFEKSVSMVVVPITDKTSWNLSRQGALQSFHCESFFLPTPTPRKVLEKRIQYLEKKMAGTEEESAKYLVGRGVTLSLPNLRAFSASLQQVFLNTGSVSDWVGGLCNHDIRRGLDLTRDIVASPHLKVIDLVKAYVAKETAFLKPVHVKKAIIRGAYNIYPVGRHRYVQNVFCLNTDIDTSPLLGLRVLRLLKDACRPEVDGEDRFVAVEQLTSYFAAMGVEPRVVGLWIEAMLKTGLCLGYDPTVDAVAETKRLEISPSGMQHLYWGLRDWVYLDAMAETTPILEPDVHRTLLSIYKTVIDRSWIEAIQEFLAYLAAEDAKYCEVPSHEAYSGQKSLMADINATKVALQNERAKGAGH
jgi:hypothetical protein